MNSGNNSYQARQTEINIGEELFEIYCNKMRYEIHRLGFNEKANPVQHFYRMNPLLRNIPDYIIETPKGTFVVNVKGTANFKKKEVDLLPLFMEWYSSKEATLIYAFCFRGMEKPILLYPEQIIDLYEKSVDKKWNDGVVYRNLNLDEKK